MSSSSRFLALGAALGLTAGLLLGLGLTQPGRAAAATPSGAPSLPSSGVVAGAPGAGSPVTTGGNTGAAAGTAITYPYPYFGGTPGLAPDHAIVVTGVGQADLQPDGSDRATAQRSAIADALADAKAQADAVAAATGLSISGVLSVSASVSPGYGIMPMMGATGGAGPGQPVPQIAPQPAYPQTISVSVTVQYAVG
jgi:hypothetical protein